MKKERIVKFKDESGNESEFVFKPLTQTILNKGDFIFRKYFAEAIRAGILTKAEALKEIEKRNIWSNEDEDNLSNLNQELTNLLDEINKIKDNKDKFLELYSKIKDTRTKIDLLKERRSNLLDSTAESMASEMKLQFFASECAFDKDGNKIFKDVEDLMSRLDERIAQEAYRCAIIAFYENGLGVELFEQLNNSKFQEDEMLESVVDEIRESTKEDESKDTDSKEEKKKVVKRRGRRKKKESTPA